MIIFKTLQLQHRQHAAALADSFPVRSFNLSLRSPQPLLSLLFRSLFSWLLRNRKWDKYYSFPMAAINDYNQGNSRMEGFN